jgi:hypothetical protein
MNEILTELARELREQINEEILAEILDRSEDITNSLPGDWMDLEIYLSEVETCRCR